MRPTVRQVQQQLLVLLLLLFVDRCATYRLGGPLGGPLVGLALGSSYTAAQQFQAVPRVSSCRQGPPTAAAVTGGAVESGAPGATEAASSGHGGAEWKMEGPPGELKAADPGPFLRQALQSTDESPGSSAAGPTRDNSIGILGRSRLRLTLTLSNNHVYACITDRSRQKTFAFASSRDQALRESLRSVKRKKGKEGVAAVASVFAAAWAAD